MKKRTVKDFVALYAPEDEEKLVLIQDGVSADKTFLDTFWAAHSHALAMADAQTGQDVYKRQVIRMFLQFIDHLNRLHKACIEKKKTQMRRITQNIF